MSEIWKLFLYQPLLNLLVFFYQLLGHNLGFAIIALTSALRLVLVPLTAPSMRATKKIQELQPELEKLKGKHGKDKQALAAAQLELYRKHNINPASGCLPQIVQLVVLIALYNAFNQVLKSSGSVADLNSLLYAPIKFVSESQINTSFFGIDLAKPNTIQIPGVPFPLPGLIVIFAAVTQYFASKMMIPQAKKAVKQAEKTPEVSDDFASTMQTQMLYMFPLMTLFIGYSFPAGLALYWLVFSVFSIIQQSSTTKAPNK